MRDNVVKLVGSYIFLVFFLPCASLAQDRIYIHATAGNYSMRDLKAFQSELLETLNQNTLPVKIVRTFPVSLQGTVGMDFQRNDTRIGFFINYALTSGKLHYADYSGYSLADQKLNRLALGFSASQNLGHHFQLYGKVGACLSFLDLNFETSLSGSTLNQKENYQYKSLGIGLEPGLSWEFPYRRLSFFINVGYEFNFSGKTKYQELDEESYLADKKGNSVLINWSGFRAASGIALTLNKK